MFQILWEPEFEICNICRRKSNSVRRFTCSSFHSHTKVCEKCWLFNISDCSISLADWKQNFAWVIVINGNSQGQTIWN